MKKYQALWPWAIVEIGLIFRLWNIAALPAWYDESYTLLVARLPLAQLLQAVAGDVHPPAYYLLAAGLAQSIKIPAMQLLLLRLFSAFCGAACLVFLWIISGQLGLKYKARIAALVLLAIHPVAIYYSQEGRMYTWLMLLVLVQCWALLGQRWWLLGLATLLAIYSHNYGLFYSAILGLLGLGYYMMQPIPVYTAGQDTVLSGPIGKLLLAMGVPVVAFLPWAWVLYTQMAYLNTFGYWLPDISAGSVISMVHRAFMGYYVFNEHWQIISLPMLVASLALALKVTRRQVALWAMLLGPVALALLVSWIWKPVLLFRGLIPSLPALAMLGGLAFTQASTRPGQVGRWLLAVPVLVGLGGQLASGYVQNSKSELYWPPDLAQPAVLVHLEDTSYITLRARWPGTQHYFLDAKCPDQPGSMSTSSRLALGYQFIQPGQLPDHYSLAAVVWGH